MEGMEGKEGEGLEEMKDPNLDKKWQGRDLDFGRLR